jgi:hypothetical protein
MNGFTGQRSPTFRHSYLLGTGRYRYRSGLVALFEGDEGSAVPLFEDAILKDLLAGTGGVHHILRIALTETLATIVLLEEFHRFDGLGHESTEPIHAGG